jgi:branched-chain amino acid transport system ATP-binding protein
MILETKELCRSFGGVMALRRVNLDLEQGEFRALIGPNGAGKTTFFNVLTGLIKSDSGQVLFNGIPITNRPPHDICCRGLSRTFQIVRIFARVSVFDSVQTAVLSHNKKTLNLFARAKNLFQEEVFRILDIVGLSDKANMASGALPHGDKKRVDMAIALANEPRVLLLDEPTTGMANEETGEIMNLVKSLRDKLGLTICFIEHDMAAVFGFADRITVMNQGSVIADASPMEIKDNEEVQRIYLGD